MDCSNNLCASNSGGVNVRSGLHTHRNVFLAHTLTCVFYFFFVCFFLSGHAVVWRDSYMENRGRERAGSTDEAVLLAAGDGTVSVPPDSEPTNLASTPGTVYILNTVRIPNAVYIHTCTK